MRLNPFRRKPTFAELIRDLAVLDAELVNPTTRANVLAFVNQVAVEGIPTPEALTEVGLANGLDWEGAQLLCALAWRLGELEVEAAV